MGKLQSFLSPPICDFWYLRAKSKEVWDDAKNRATALIEAMQSPGYHGLVIGALLEEQHTPLLIGGWDSLEVRCPIKALRLFANDKARFRRPALLL